MKAKRTVSILVAMTALLCLGSTAAFATTVPDFPSWWKTPVDAPDGVTRTQAHFFHSDPNTMPSPDWAYDGFIPVVQDFWNTNIVSAFDVDGAISPFFDSAGVKHGDGVAKGAIIGQPGTMSKLMGNLPSPNLMKLFHVEIIWYGNLGGVTLGVQSEGDVQITGEGTISNVGWHLTWMDGYIWPQPTSETFMFNFATEGIYVDAAYIGTHCTIPEPGSMLALLAGIGGLGGLIRRRKT